MNLIWHIVKKDARRLVWPLGIWAALMAAQFVLGGVLLWRDGMEATILQRLALYHELLFGLQVIVCYVTVGALVHEDGLIGTQTWWVTRPVSGARLLGAKLCGLALLFGALPVAVALPWWLACGFGPRELAWAALETGFCYAALTSLGLGLAVLSENATRFLLYTLLLVFGASTFSATAKVAASAQAAALLPEGAMATRGWIVVVLFTGTIVAVVVNQFLTRRTWLSWACLGVGLAAAGLASCLWPWDWSTWAIWQKREPAALARATVSVVSASLTDTTRKTKEDEPATSVRMRVRFEGVPVGFALCNGWQRSTWSWAGGVRWEARGSAFGTVIPAARRVVEPEAQPTALPVWATSTMPRSLADKMRSQPARWASRLHLEVWQGEVVAEVPLKAGASGGRAGHRVRICEVKRLEDGHYRVEIGESVPAMYAESGEFSPRVASAQWGAQYFLCSRDRTQVLELPGRGAAVATRVGSVGVLRQTLASSVRSADLGAGAKPSASWLDDAVLVKVAFRPAGEIERVARTDALTIEPENRRP